MTTLLENGNLKKKTPFGIPTKAMAAQQIENILKCLHMTFMHS
jgi:hypothetical protein